MSDRYRPSDSSSRSKGGSQSYKGSFNGRSRSRDYFAGDRDYNDKPRERDERDRRDNRGGSGDARNRNKERNDLNKPRDRQRDDRYDNRERNDRDKTSNDRDRNDRRPKAIPTGPSGYRGGRDEYSRNDRDAYRPSKSTQVASSGPPQNSFKNKRSQVTNEGGDYKRQDRKDQHRNQYPKKFNRNGSQPSNQSRRPKGPGSANATNFNSKIAPKLRKELTPQQIYSFRTVRPSEIYSRVQQVGEGTYGKVYKARNEISNEFVALKKLRLESEREGFPITAIREIKLLQSFNHPNVVGLLEMMVESNQIYMIFDYMAHDLTGLLTHHEIKLEECHRKFIFLQLTEGLAYLHHKRVIHRDIKGSNILLDAIGNVKIADFGLARTMKTLKKGESPDYTNRVITIWYRPPELLLGSTEYGREVDVWGIGCLLVELYSKQAVFQGFDEVGQLQKIFNIMGTPSIQDWPHMDELPWFEMLKPKVNKKGIFEDEYKNIMSVDSFDLALKLLTYDPVKRWTAQQALGHPYFTNEPRPEPLYFLKKLEGEWHEFETKKKRRRDRKKREEQEKADREREKSLASISKETDSLKQNEDDMDIISIEDKETTDVELANKEDYNVEDEREDEAAISDPTPLNEHNDVDLTCPTDPTIETKVEEPASDTKVEEPTVETKVEEPTTETKVEEPETETNVEEPATETKVEEPTTEKLGEPTAETKVGEPTTEDMSSIQVPKKETSTSAQETHDSSTENNDITM